MIIFKKKHIVTLTMIGVLLIAGYLNIVYMNNGANDPNQTVANIEHQDDGVTDEQTNFGSATFVSTNIDNKSGGSSNDAFIKESNLDKEKARSKALEILRSVSNDANSTPEAKQKAQQEIINIAKNVEREAAVTNILKGKKFENVSAYISENGATVSVKAEELSPQEVAQIRDAVIGETQLTADKIKIIEID